MPAEFHQVPVIQRPTQRKTRRSTKADRNLRVPAETMKYLASITLAPRVVNPLANGNPLRFANSDQDQYAPGWLSLGILPASP